MSETNHDRLVWVSEGRIATQNADGGATAWEDPHRLYAELGEMILLMDRISRGASVELEKIVNKRSGVMTPSMSDPSYESRIRALLKKHGGNIHGPRVETVSIPEAAFFRFLAEFAEIVRGPPMSDTTIGGGTLE